MRKYYPALILSAILICICSNAYSQGVKIIQLKDGSTLKGKVLQLENGIYTLETSNLGEMAIAESDILSIASENFVSNESVTTTDTQKIELQNHVEQIQGTILSDEDVMADIQKLIEDEDVKAILSDPGLMKDVTSFDQQKIEQNSNVQDLMNNPKIQQLMHKIQQKIPAQ